MPKLLQPTDPVVLEARKRLKAYLRQRKLTPTELAKEMQCNQSTVQRFLAGRTRTLTPKVRELLSHAGISVEMCMQTSIRSAADNRHIRDALDRVWDGDEQSAQRLAALIVAVAPLLGLMRPSTTN